MLFNYVLKYGKVKKKLCTKILSNDKILFFSEMLWIILYKNLHLLDLICLINNQ